MSDMPQQPIAGRYRLVRPLGQGGQGRVWLARDEMLRRDVALKELVASAGLTATEQGDLRERSMREARTIARIDQPNVVRIFDVLHEGGEPWIVMELVDSRALHEVLHTEGPMTPERAAHLGLSVLAALQAAHDAGVLHRDVKPANVLMARDGRVVLTDFGLATAAEDPGLTQTGVVLGSPAFLAPERALDHPVGPPSDLWSLGAVLYAAVEGRSPYQRSTALATLAALSTELPPPPEHAGPLLPALEGLLRRDPAARIDAVTAERLLRQALLDGPVVSGPPPASPTFSGTELPVAALPTGPASSVEGAQPDIDPPGPPVEVASRRLLVGVLAAVALLVLGAGILLVKPGVLGTEADAARQPSTPATSAQPSSGATPAGGAPASGPATPPTVPLAARPAQATLRPDPDPTPTPAKTRTGGGATKPVATKPAATGKPLKNMGTHNCMDVPDSDPDTSEPVQVWSCHEAAGQRFTMPGDGTVRVLGKCLRIDGTEDGSTLSIGACTGGAGQQFDLNSSHDLVNLKVVRCLEVPYDNPDDGVLVRLIPCGGESHMKWSLG